MSGVSWAGSRWLKTTSSQGMWSFSTPAGGASGWWITQYHSGAPGIGLEVARWLVKKEVTAVGSDTVAVEVFPNPDPDLFFPVHTELIPRNGIFLQENLDLSAPFQK